MGITYGTSTLFQATKGIVQDGLVLNLDAGVNKSYPRNGTTWYDLSNTGNGTLTNGPTFSRNNGGGIRLGSNPTWWRSDWGRLYDFSVGVQGKYQGFTVEMWYKHPSTTDRVHLWAFGFHNRGDQSNVNMNLNDGNAI